MKIRIDDGAIKDSLKESDSLHSADKSPDLNMNSGCSTRTLVHLVSSTDNPRFSNVISVFFPAAGVCATCTPCLRVRESRRKLQTEETEKTMGRVASAHQTGAELLSPFPIPTRLMLRQRNSES